MPQIVARQKKEETQMHETHCKHPIYWTIIRFKNDLTNLPHMIHILEQWNQIEGLEK